MAGFEKRDHTAKHLSSGVPAGRTGQKTSQFINSSVSDWWIYTISYALLFFVAFFPLIKNGKAFLWRTDGINQQYQTLIYTKEWIDCIVKQLSSDSALEIPLWDLRVGLGEGVFNTVLYPRAVNFLYALFDKESIELFLIIKTVIYSYLSGLSYLFFVKRRSNNCVARVIGALLYVFSGYSLFFAARHGFFLEMMILFPIMCRGIDGLFERGHSVLITISVFIACVSYFYFAYIVILAAMIYAIGLYFSIYKRGERRANRFFYLLLCGFLNCIEGVLLSAFSLLPSLIQVADSTRVGIQSSGFHFFWDLSYYADLIQSVLTMNEFGHYGFLAIPALGFYSVVCLPDKGMAKVTKNQLAVYAVGLLFPFFSSMFNGFAGNTLRWCFIIAFWIAVATTQMLEVIVEGDTKLFARTICFAGLYCVVYLVEIVLLDHEPSYSIISFFVVMSLISLFVMKPELASKQIIMYLIVIFAIFIDVGTRSYELFSVYGNGYLTSFVDSGEVANIAEHNAACAIGEINDHSVFRTDLVSVNRQELYNQLNYGLPSNTNGTYAYYSYLNSHLNRFASSLANSQLENSFLVSGWSQRTTINELLSVKYLATFHPRNSKIPFGYRVLCETPVEVQNGTNMVTTIYENEFALPLVYSYDKMIDQNVYYDSTPYRREQLLLQGALFDDDYSALPPASLHYDDFVVIDTHDLLKQIGDEISCSSVKVQSDCIVVEDSGAGIPITIDLPTGLEGELYLYLSNADYSGIAQADKHTDSISATIDSLFKSGRVPDSTTVVATCNGVNDTVVLLNKSAQYYYGPHDVLLNLGYVSNPSSITLYLYQPGVYHFNTASIVLEPLSNYVSDVERLRMNQANEVVIDKNDVVADITVPDRSVVVLSVPYSRGWNVFVDDEEVDTLCVNQAFIGAIVEGGTHVIRYHYRLPGMMIGAGISTGTLIVSLIFLVRKKSGRTT